MQQDCYRRTVCSPVRCHCGFGFSREGVGFALRKHLVRYPQKRAAFAGVARWNRSTKRH